MDPKRLGNAMLGLNDYTTADVLNQPIRRGAILPWTEYADRSEFDLSSGITGSMGSAITAPARAYRGEMTDDQMIDEGANLAGWLTLGGYMSPKPVNALGAGGGGIKAFHGSPHDFDKFDMSKIGTGEGAQAYGHGLYFAEAEDVARSYRDQLGKFGDKFGPKENAWDLVNRYGQDPKTLADQMDAIPDKSQMMVDTIQALRDGTYKNINAPGHMYEVNIKANPEDFLDWDKPLSQQSEAIREAFSKAVMPGNSADDVLMRDLYGSDVAAQVLGLFERSKGSQAYNTFADKLTPPPSHTARRYDNASQALREAGIPGIRYLDQGSRGAGEGSSNYVVFDDALIEIMRKYGLLGPVAAGTIAAAINDEGPIY